MTVGYDSHAALHYDILGLDLQLKSGWRTSSIVSGAGEGGSVKLESINNLGQ